MSANGSESSHPEWNPSSPTFTMVMQVCMFIAIATVNVLTLVVMAMTPKLQTIPNTYIASLAVSDLVVSFNQLMAIPWTSPKYHEHFEREPSLCMFFKCLLHINELTSLFTIVLIGLDRFVYIRYPFWYLRVVTKTKVKVAIVVVWALSFTLALPIRMTRSDSRFPGCDAHALLYDSKIAGYVHGALYFLLCFVLFISYGVVIRTAVQQARAIQATQRHHISESNPSATEAAVARAERKRRAESLEARLSLKIVQKMAGVFLVLFICWTPYATIGLIGPMNVNQQIILLSGFLAAFNSFANFGVYALADREFRAATVNVLCCRKNDANRVVSFITSSVTERQRE